MATNFEVFKKSNKYPDPGGVFVYKMIGIDDLYFFGRVVRTDALVGGFEDTILLYFYNASSEALSKIPLMSCHELLFPPVATNALGWRKGFFMTILNLPLAKGDTLERHCFKDSMRGWYFDDNGNRLDGPTHNLIGDYALDSYKTIGDRISEALGLPETGD